MYQVLKLKPQQRLMLMSRPIYTEKIGAISYDIFRQRGGTSPRILQPIGTFVAWHTYSWFSDKHNFKDMSDFISFMQNPESNSIVVPVYIYEKPELNISTRKKREDNAYSIGFIYITVENAKAEAKTEFWYSEIVNALEDEIKDYNWYLTSEVYSYSIKDANRREIEQSFNFYGPYETNLVPFVRNRVKEFLSMEEEAAKDAVKVEVA